jgi:hypothetical protein
MQLVSGVAEPTRFPRYPCGVTFHRWPYVLLPLIVASCRPDEPPRWAQGGAQLTLPSARWARADDDMVEIQPNGHVLEDGDLLFVIDRVGRIVDSDYEPVALLFQDGRLAGTDDRVLGHVGVSNAAPPDRMEAWLAVMPDGNVVYFGSDGDREPDGKWEGCSGPALRTCTLVTHLLAVRNYGRRSESGVGVGIGIGIGF